MVDTARQDLDDLTVLQNVENRDMSAILNRISGFDTNLIQGNQGELAAIHQGSDESVITVESKTVLPEVEISSSPNWNWHEIYDSFDISNIDGGILQSDFMNEPVLTSQYVYDTIAASVILGDDDGIRDAVLSEHVDTKQTNLGTHENQVPLANIQSVPSEIESKADTLETQVRVEESIEEPSPQPTTRYDLLDQVVSSPEEVETIDVVENESSVDSEVPNSEDQEESGEQGTPEEPNGSGSEETSAEEPGVEDSNGETDGSENSTDGLDNDTNDGDGTDNDTDPVSDPDDSIDNDTDGDVDVPDDPDHDDGGSDIDPVPPDPVEHANNGHGNGDQEAPGNSLEHNNAENKQDDEDLDEPHGKDHEEHDTYDNGESEHHDSRDGKSGGGFSEDSGSSGGHHEGDHQQHWQPDPEPEVVYFDLTTGHDIEAHEGSNWTDVLDLTDTNSNLWVSVGDEVWKIQKNQNGEIDLGENASGHIYSDASGKHEVAEFHNIETITF